MPLILNYLLYQIGWLACVLGAAWGRPWWGVAAGLTLLATHFLLVRDRGLELRLTFVVAVIGLSVDCLLLWSGVFRFDHGNIVTWLPPPWMMVLWLQFAATLHFCMRWMRGRFLLGAVFGFVAAPLAFYFGERLGAVRFLEPRAMHFAMLAGVWALAIPCLLWFEERLSQNAEAASYRFFDRAKTSHNEPKRH